MEKAGDFCAYCQAQPYQAGISGAVEAAKGAKHVFFFEEGIEQGGVGEHFEHLLHEAGFHGAYVLRAIQGFVRHATMQESLHDLGLDADGIYRTVTDTLQNWK